MQHFQPGYDFPGLSQSASSWTAPYLAPTQDDFMNGEWNMQPHMEAPSPFPDQPYRDFDTTITSISQDGPPRPLLIEVQSNEDATEQSVPTYHACRLLGPPCGSLLEGSIQSIRSHLRFHGHRHEESAIILCPWQGCTAQLQYMSIPRHIRSTHLGVRFRCEKCGKTLTREEGLAKHVKRCTRSS